MEIEPQLKDEQERPAPSVILTQTPGGIDRKTNTQDLVSIIGLLETALICYREELAMSLRANMAAAAQQQQQRRPGLIVPNPIMNRNGRG